MSIEESEKIQATLERARDFGTKAGEQSKIVDEMLDTDGCTPVGVGFYIANTAGVIFCIDPWANVIEYKQTEITKEVKDA